ncbi:MAG: KamA family radical SAM protein [Treponemataceae bacterium]
MIFEKKTAWQKQINFYKNSNLPHFLSLKNNEALVAEKTSPFGTAITTHYLQVMKNLWKENRLADFYALQAQVIPAASEENIFSDELRDPLGGEHYKKSPRLIHQYKNRVLLIANGLCFAHCRYCFRKDYLALREGFIRDDDIKKACDYIKLHPHIDEILLSGGDVLFASDSQIMHLISQLRAAKKDLLIRICTRAPTFLPERLTKKLLKFLQKNKPIWLIPHINHPAELSAKTIECFENILNAGIPIHSQTVLLKNVNDNVETLKKLFTQLTKIGIKAGYLFQCDLARGISHFRAPLDEALSLYQNLSTELSGLSLPQFALDLPNGGGKINLATLVKSDLSVDRTKEKYLFTKNGKSYEYPVN